ncbi:DrmB family protein [Nocardia sp. NPDC058640]|uniref:DrmB family protein n=1 Tax=Nocardia sp. NPDC058640 TaxID=3346571 RepID=UPI00364A6B63
MTPPKRRNRIGGATGGALRKLGQARRSQLVTTYGVGALIAVENESFIVASHDSWGANDAPKIFERRLAQLLSVDHFRLPPSKEADKAFDGVRVHRFPDYYSCPKCQQLQRYWAFNSPKNEAVCVECNSEKLVPSRFVVVCDNGHIDDFPYWEWVHRGPGRDRGSGGCVLRIRTVGASASLRAIRVSCSCGAPEVSMEGAFSKRALQEIGIKCGGRRPWLAAKSTEGCEVEPKTMQRGSSSVWHPIVQSALSIPPWGEGIHALVEKHMLLGKGEAYVREYLADRPGLLERVDATVNDVLAVIAAAAESDSAENGDVPVVQRTSALRQQEYDRLVRGNPEKDSADWQPFVCERPLGDVAPLVKLNLEQPMLVKRLREVRALAAFVRGELPTEADPDSRRCDLRDQSADWLPAIEVIGEGVFLRLSESRLRQWETDATVVDRAERIRKHHREILQDRAKKKAQTNVVPDSHVTPRQLLLHTLAHALIIEWSLDCGYSASALRERIYSDEEMAGILIYTATTDSAGSLGGLVAQGEPMKLEASVRSALSRAHWCSNDPLCMESEASGAESLNLAACHACVLLPETSCESMNSFLDRGLLVGEAESGLPGYFGIDSV